MSAIALIAAPPTGRPADREILSRMLRVMRRRGGERAAVQCMGTAALGVSRFAWELDDPFSGSALVVCDDDIAVAADASLYHRRDLEGKLRTCGVRVGGPTPTHLILAAYRAWGTECPRHLEGDFAFVVWDARVGSVFAARDFVGKRPLLYTCVRDTLVVASTPAGILAHPACAGELDLTVLGEEAAALTGTPEDTCWRGVRRLVPGRSVHWRGGALRVSAHWAPPNFRDRGEDTPFHRAAVELRELLGAATVERMSPVGRTALFLSGGWDSPAIYGGARHALAARGDGHRTLDAVSVSFPPGDPGCEDAMIAAILDHWRADGTWVQSRDVPLLERMIERAAERDEPLPHPFEMMNRALARAARALGARVVLDGSGGDQLFQVSTVYLADLLARGAWRKLAREWREQGQGGVRTFLRVALLPALPMPLLRALAILGAPARVVEASERRPPAWMHRRFLAEHEIERRERAHVPRRRGRSRAAHELACQLTRPLVWRMTTALSTAALEEGVEHRSPLLDARILRYAAGRPISDRRAGRETKRLLRSAMRGLLPDHVLAPRAYRTGSPIRYLVGAIETELPAVIERTMRDSVLGDLGVIDPAVFRQSWDDAIRRGDPHQCVAVYLTLEVELWTRARMLGPGGVVSGVGTQHRMNTLVK